MTPDAIALTVSDDLERKRATVFFRLLLAVPHLFLLTMLTGVVFLMAPVVWIVALVRGQVPDSLHEFYVRLVRYSVHVYAYLYLGAQPWPPIFGEGSYPIDVTVPPPARQNRWTIAFRLILALPALTLAGTLGAGQLSVSSQGGFAYQFGVLPAVALLGWFACLARARMPRGMRDLLAYALLYGAQAYGYLLLVTPRYPNADPAQLGIAELPEHPVTLDIVGDDERRHRLMVFFRGPLALVHIVWLLLWTVVSLLAMVAGWLAALVLGRLPGPLHRFLAALVRYNVHVYGFLYLVANPFPGFVGRNEGYPIHIEIGPPERQNRWTIFFRGLLGLPAGLIAGALGSTAGIAAVLAWFASLFTGRMPHGLRNLMAYALRYQAQVHAYFALLTPRYPYSGPGPCRTG